MFEPKLLTVAEVAERLNVSRSHVYRLALAGRLERVTVGVRAVRYTAASVAAIAATGQTSPPPEQGGGLA